LGGESGSVAPKINFGRGMECTSKTNMSSAGKVNEKYVNVTEYVGSVYNSVEAA